ncbi:GNAT family N-acetyltransferase [Parvicella tangerina]|uniref:N-acetyltransferase domain-containing protein n=1 Tax=Parvicella tangerina TaxID=2829795 RepID=A0A916NGD1_9FLAO|nr:GNAT family N-acetyltransferase [Parvicella tangerina]CAG5080342.1 hypothetical protein CRYO30217_01264 [Parvicella tangerina]
MFSVRKALYEDYYAILSLADEQLGKGYLQGILKLDTQHVVWVAERQSPDQLVGFIFLALGKSKTMIKSIAVKKSFQSKGVGRLLFNVAMKELASSTDEFEVLAWERSDTGEVPLARLLKKFGFVQTSRKNSQWRQDSIGRGYACPSCGNPCECNAVVFSIPSSYFSESND